MKFASLIAIAVCLLGFRDLPARQSRAVTAEQAGDAYTITTVVRLAEPYDVRAMNDEFQSARLLSESAGVGTFEITYRPYHKQVVSSDPNWRRHDSIMAEYLVPRPAANWDKPLQTAVLSDLNSEGVDPEKMDDKSLVEAVSRWALKRSSFNDQFGLWMVDFEAGKPEISVKLRPSFEANEPKGMSDPDVFDRELFGAGMYRNRTHGSCTSTATYMATILRAVGIPTRIILTVPACDPNDPKQVKTLLDAVRDNRTRHIIGLGLTGNGFVNHVYNEVWVGGKWVRLNYDRLGQPILDPNYLGLMTHVYTAKDFSEVPFSKTWGSRFALHDGPKLSSVNPYELVSAKDRLEEGLDLINPAVKELTSVTVIAILGRGDPSLHGRDLPQGNDALLQIKEWLKEDNHLQLRVFLKDASPNFTFKAPGHPDVAAKITGFNTSDGQGTFQGFGIKVEAPLAAGVAYKLVANNGGYKHSWRVDDSASLSVGSTAQGSPKTIHCAVMASNLVDLGTAACGDFADYKGRRYFFCCGACPGAFKRDPATYASNESIPIPVGSGAVVEGLNTATIIAPISGVRRRSSVLCGVPCARYGITARACPSA